ncbi:MAG: hypothetical protein KJ060_07220, partial [Candidatus Hydrogenedentes bacterium]|nr:hypothetical protein [Candidatus Hydrogenedentota bacterium]
MITRVPYLFFVGVALFVAGSVAWAQDSVAIHVSQAGNDSWSGALASPNAEGTDGPFATLVRARDEVRRMKADAGLPEGGVRVVVHGGRYEFGEVLTLTSEDSGTEQARVTYVAADGEEVRISGGRVVNGFAPVTDAAELERLDPSAREHVVKADLRAMGIEDFGSPAGGGMEVFFRDQPMTLSRWPNDGFTHIADLVVDDGHKIHGIPGSTVGKFIYEGDRPERWVGEKDPWVHGYWFWDWSDQRQQIAAIDVEKHEIAVTEPYHGYGYRKGQWFYGYNLLIELDLPGEWYLDRETGVLY